MLGSSDNFIKVDLTFGYLFENSFISNYVCLGREHLIVQLFVGKDTNPDVFTNSCWKNARASDVLITLGWVNIELDDHFKALREPSSLADIFGLLNSFFHRELIVDYVHHFLKLRLCSF